MSVHEGGGRQRKAVVLSSGGIDSTVLAYEMRARGYELHLLSFDYGQRHRKELNGIHLLMHALAGVVRHDVVHVPNLGKLLSGSALTDPSVDVPEGHYADETMRSTVVPNRNAIFLSIAFGVAVAEQADVVTFGAHAGDHPIYPDCRPVFTVAFDLMQQIAIEGYGKPGLGLLVPFLNMTKTQIVKHGASLHVPFEDTWSCYKGGELHCGKCGTCVERREAFTLAGVKDPTEYEA